MIVVDISKITTSLSLNYSTNVGFSVSTNESVIKLTDLKSIWYRRIRYPTFEGLDLPASHIIHEFRVLMNGIWQANQNIKYLPNPIFENLADNKVYQMATAKNVGLNVPPTIIGNDPNLALEFIKTYPKS